MCIHQFAGIGRFNTEEEIDAVDLVISLQRSFDTFLHWGNAPEGIDLKSTEWTATERSGGYHGV